MNPDDQFNINGLVGEFLDLQEQWENEPGTLDWKKLEELAQKGAHAYNEGAGPSFHALVLDGICHTEFHERFLTYSVEAGFDPFKLVRVGSGNSTKPVISHDSLAHASKTNEISHRMRTLLMNIAEQRFSLLVNDGIKHAPGSDNANVWAILQSCPESFPLDMLMKAAPELAKSH